MIRAAASRFALWTLPYFPLPARWQEALAEYVLRLACLDGDISYARYVVEAWPDLPQSYLRLATLLRRTHQLDVADDVLQEAARRFPWEPDILANYAANADVAGACEEALRRWQAVLRDFPNKPIGYAGMAIALLRLQRGNEAQDVLAKGLALFPEDLNLAANEAVLLGELGEHEAALIRWRRLRGKAPDRPMYHVGEATALRHLRHIAVSDEILRETMQRFPDAVFVYRNFAVNADAAGDPEEALRRWQVVLERFPHETIGYAGVGAALKTLRRFDAADAVIAEGIAKFPQDLNLAVNHAQVSVARDDWTDAKRRWQRVAEQWPEDEYVQSGLADAEMRDLRGRLRNLALAFESLGENCELGFVQGQFGVAPLGLFRWAGIRVEHLITALETDLVGIGDEEFTSLTVDRNVGEYHALDRRYGMNLHTSMFEGVTPEKAVYAQVTRRLTFLCDKLREDLREARKLFVVNTPAALPHDDLLRLRNALHRYGPCKLLHVNGHSQRPAGEIVQRDKDIWEAALSHPGFDGQTWNIDFEVWQQIMWNAAHMRLVEDLIGLAEEETQDPVL